ncbi:hypothetical protein TNCV_1974811 [Trichonephila clavipes]|nr:hypothetical protein TNCV_1974811 [Trichonephila clavipes]
MRTLTICTTADEAYNKNGFQILFNIPSYQGRSYHRINDTGSPSYRGPRRVIDSQQLQKREHKELYWRKVLKRIISTIKLLSRLGVAFRGHDDGPQGKEII